ncbi:MAG: cytochrome c, partial [Anaerolineales bacterium]|nr:cytochrome c [Anaerolineales bacterium]
SQMLGDDFLYWRISEGGHEFETAMPSWDGTLDEEARWDVINYIRALGAGTAVPAMGMGAGGQGDQHAEMLDTAVLQAVITSEEAELFTAVHDEMDALTASGDIQRSGGMNDMQEQLLTTLVEQETITAEDADAFRDIHNRLIESGLMQ